jgi:amino acid adenylation domain-containing protein
MVIAATAVYVHRLTGARDVVVGLPVTARQGSLLKRTPGMVSNVLPLRLSVRPDMSPSELVGQVAREVREVLAHQRYRGEDLHRDLGLPGNVGTSFVPVINIMSFDYDLSFAGYRAAVHKISVGQIGDLSIVVWDGRDGSGLWIDWQAHPEVCGQNDLAVHQQRFVSLLETIAVADPDRPISRIDLLTIEERTRLLVAYNTTALPIPQAGLPALFEARARVTPEAVAVVFADTTVSYAQLNARANQLAHALIACGVGPERAVALLLERSVDLVVSILAVLKAGGAYVPLDTRYPASRMRLVMQETGASVLVTDQALHAHEFFHSADVVIVDADPGLAEQDPGDPGIVCDPEQLAYVMYTSGSTGQPKGIAVTHRDVVSLALDPCWRGGDHQRVLLHSPCAFDASTYELWVPLLSGGQVVIVPPGELDIRTMERVITQNNVTGLWLTAGLFSLIAEQCPGCFDSVRQVWTGGDVVSAAAVARVLDACPAITVVNGYGPTETTTFAVHHPMRAPYNAAHTVPIGRPMANMRAYVLDAGLQPVPPGAAGELYLGGAGLARGYVGQSGLTAGRFVADPYGPAGTRLYRTGDLVRWRGDGNLEFIGRADDQVKIRGFRIEPGEIEAVLAERDEVARSAVVACEDGPGGKRLVGYLVPSGATDRIDTLELRRALDRTLPDYLVPSVLVVVLQLPLTPSGKVDRRALALRPVERAVTTARTAPRGELEQRIAEIWSHVLEVEQVGADDSFFDLGGHSLLLVTLQSGLAALVERPVPIVDLFTHTTVAAQARHLGRAAAASPKLAAARERAQRRALSRSRRPPAPTRKDTPPHD